MAPITVPQKHSSTLATGKGGVEEPRVRREKTRYKHAHAHAACTQMLLWSWKKSSVWHYFTMPCTHTKNNCSHCENGETWTTDHCCTITFLQKKKVTETTVCQATHWWGPLQMVCAQLNSIQTKVKMFRKQRQNHSGVAFTSCPLSIINSGTLPSSPFGATE